MLSNTRFRDLAFDRRGGVYSSRVLVVGADPMLLEEVSGIIQKIGSFEIRGANSMEDALRVVSEFRPGFVLLNSDASDLDSYRFASLLHQRADLLETRIIGLTKEIASVDRQAALAAGFEQVLTLPLRQLALDAVLRCTSHRGPQRQRAQGI